MQGVKPQSQKKKKRQKRLSMEAQSLQHSYTHKTNPHHEPAEPVPQVPNACLAQPSPQTPANGIKHQTRRLIVSLPLHIA